MIWGRKENRTRKPVIIDVFIDPSRAVIHLKKISRWEHIRKFAREYWMVVLAPLVMAVGLIYFISASAGTAEIYATSCLGDWEAASNAQGEPNLKSGSDPVDFSLDNSAVWRGGAKQIFCGGFVRDPDDTELKGARVRFSWVAKAEEPPPASPQGGGEPPTEPSPEINTEEPTSIELFEPVPPEEPPAEVPAPDPPIEIPEPPVETPAPEPPAPPVETPAPKPSPPTPPPKEEGPPAEQSFWQRILLIAFAEEENPFEPLPTSADPIVEPPVETPEVTEPVTEPIVEPLSPEPEPENIVATDDLLEILYTLDGENWVSLGRVRADNLREAVFDLPLTDWSQLEKLQISVQGVMTVDETPEVYLDAVWLDVDWEKIEQEKKEEKQKEDKGNGRDFKAEENIEIEIDLDNPGEEIISESQPEQPVSFLKRLINIAWADAPDIVIDEIVDPANHPVDLQSSVAESGWGKRKITIEKPENSFHPGKYKIKFTVKNKQYKQDFTWGVLAINTNKSIYLPGETAKIGMALLNDYGQTKCPDAQFDFYKGKMWLTIESPDGTTQNFSTEDGTIWGSGVCDLHSVTNEADFQTTFTTAESGIYKMHLEGEHENGRRSIDDEFVVASSGDDAPYDIERASVAMRIYPAADYTNSMRIAARQSYNGQIEEYVPSSFELSNISGGGRVEEGEKFKKIIWDVNLEVGDTITLQYTYDPPNISPEFYLLGPLTLNATVGGFAEARRWQIASDATKTWDGGCTGGSAANFSCANNWADDTAPGTTDDIVFPSTCTGACDDAATWDASAQTTYNSITRNAAYDGALTFTKTPVTITGALDDQNSAGSTVFTGSLALSVGGDVTLLETLTVNTSTLTMTGTANLNTAQSLNNLTINGAGTTVTVVTSNPTVSGTLTIGAAADSDNDTLSIGSGRTVTSDTAGTVTLVGSGTDTISGAGNLDIKNSNLGTGGTISSNVRFIVPNAGSLNVPARSYGANMTVTTTGGSATGVMLAGTFNITGDLIVQGSTNIGGTVTLDANTNDPTISVTGDFRMDLNLGAPTFSASSNTAAPLTITDDFTKAQGTFTHNSGKVIFDGASTSTLAYDANISFGDFTVSTASKPIEFDETQSTTVAGTFTIDGSSCDTPVRLWSSTLNNDWPVTLNGTVSVNYADIRDSTAAASYTANSSTDSGGNTNWTINTCTSLTFSVDSATVSFGTVTPGSYGFATSTLSINTTNSTGYYVVLYGNNQGTLSASTTMYWKNPDVDYTINIPDATEWVPGAATTSAGNASTITALSEFLAFRPMTASGSPAFRAATWWGSDDTPFTNALWAGFASSTINRQIGNSNVPTSGTELISIQYFLNVPATQRAGVYNGDITFSATTNP